MIGQPVARPFNASNSLEIIAGVVAAAPAVVVLAFTFGIAARELAFHSFAGKRRRWLTFGFGLGSVFLILHGRVFFST